MCQKQFTKNSTLEYHMTIHTGQKSCVCHLCQSKFNTNKEVTKHIQVKHKDNDKYPCKFCSDIFEKPRLLKTHLNIHFKHKFPCSLCRKTFSRKKGLKDHFKSHTIEKIKCRVCSKSFHRNQTLKLHMTYAAIPPFICDVCNYDNQHDVNQPGHVNQHDVGQPGHVNQHNVNQPVHVNQHNVNAYVMQHVGKLPDQELKNVNRLEHVKHDEKSSEDGIKCDVNLPKPEKHLHELKSIIPEVDSDDDWALSDGKYIFLLQ